MTTITNPIGVPGQLTILPSEAGDGTIDPGGTIPQPASTSPYIETSSIPVTRTNIVDDGKGLVSVTSTSFNFSDSVENQSAAETARLNRYAVSEKETINLNQNSEVLPQVPLENPLHGLNNYTYNLSLHMIGIQQYNLLINANDPAKEYVPQNVLVASAGKYSDFFVRSPNFQEDFFFENFSMKTYINTTHRNRNSNLIECNFTLIEPNGFTFIDRLIETFKDVEGTVGNYLQVPYMLQIDFFGYDDEGNLISDPLEDFRKYIPVRLLNIKTKITNKGTEYNINCAPFNHSAFNQIYSYLEFGTSVSGTTVKEIFGQLTADEARRQASVQPFVSRQRELINERNELNGYIAAQDASPEAAGYGDRQAWINQIATIENELKTNYSNLEITGYCNALNEWYYYLQKEGLAAELNSVAVVFDPEIGNARLLTGSQPAVPGNSANSRNATQTAVNAATRSTLSYTSNEGKGTVNIPPTTDITKLIDWAVRNSSYIGEQISNEADRRANAIGADPNTFTTWLNWFKIIPKIKINRYDTILKRYSFDITYYVKKYALSSKHPSGPIGKVPGFVKQYDYIFTGKNKDIIDLDIDLNALYVVEVSALRNKDTVIQSDPADGNQLVLADTDNIDPYAPFSDNLYTASIPKARSNIPVTGDAAAIVLKSQDRRTLPAPGSDQANKYIAGDIQRSLTNSARGDMVEVQLKILGDPHFIKQDDIFYDSINFQGGQFVSGYTPISTTQGNTGSSLFMDQGELYVFLNFKTPVDYNELTGLVEFDNNYRFSKYSGVYKVITVDNNFSKGKFEQSLKLVKLFYTQDGQSLLSTPSGREVTQNNYSIQRIAASRYAGPLVNLVNSAVNPVNRVTQAMQNSGELSSSAIRSLNLSNARAQQGAAGLADRIIGMGVNQLVNKGIREAGRIAYEAGVNLYQNGLSGAANNFGFEVTTDPTQFGVPSAGAESAASGAASEVVAEASGAVAESVGAGAAEVIVSDVSLEAVTAGLEAGAELAGFGFEVAGAAVEIAEVGAVVAEAGAVAAEFAALAELSAVVPILAPLAVVAFVASGGCFITTACVEYFNLDDNCYELTKLRQFRDSYMIPNHRELVEEYYENAPIIVDRLQTKDNKKEIYEKIYNDYIKTAVQEIENNNFKTALTIYKNLYYYAKSKVEEIN